MLKRLFSIVFLVTVPLSLLSCLPAYRGCPHGPAGRADTVHLKGETSVEGKILKEDERIVVVDLGYDVLVIPRTQVMEIERAREEEEGQRSQAEEPTPADSLSQLTKKPSGAPGPEKSVKELVDLYENSVVVISNAKGWGTGFIITPDGFCLTNHHVISGERKNSVTIFTKSGESVEKKRIEEVEIVAFNRYFDIALLKIKDEAVGDLELTVAPFGDEEELKTGDPVMAIGNPGAYTLEKKGLQRHVWHHTVSEGIVSSKARNIRGIPYIQTTAPVNPGNSGGPLFSLRGQVVGIVTLKSYFQENIAFAVPVNYVRDFIKNRAAFAFSKDNPNLGYRYLAPPKRKKLEEPVQASSGASQACEEEPATRKQRKEADYEGRDNS